MDILFSFSIITLYCSDKLSTDVKITQYDSLPFRAH